MIDATGSFLALVVGVVLGVFSLIAFFIWRELRRARLADPCLAPPAWGPELAHQFTRADGLLCCSKCGGGVNHSVHHGVRYAPKVKAAPFKGPGSEF